MEHNNIFYLFTFHGDIIFWNENTLTFENHKYLGKLYEKMYIFYIKDQGLFIQKNNEFFRVDKFLKSTLDINFFGRFLTIKNSKKYLSCDKNGQLLFSKEEARGWEFFYLKCVVDLNLAIKADNYFFNKDRYVVKNDQNRNLDTIPKKVWIYWEENPPELVLKCVNRIKQFNPEFEVFFLDKNNVSDYISGLNIFLDHINPTLRSDIIRLKLLYIYGGVWMDSSIILNERLDTLFDFDKTCYDLMGFYYTEHYQKFQKNRFPVVESWLLVAPKNSFIVGKCLDYLTLVLTEGVDGTLKKLSLRKDFNILKNSFQKLDYFLPYLTQQAVFHDFSSKLNLYLKCADYSALYYHCTLGWRNKYKFQELCFLKYRDIHYLPKLIKLTRNDRGIFKELAENKLIDKDSFIAQNFL